MSVCVKIFRGLFLVYNRFSDERLDGSNSRNGLFSVISGRFSSEMDQGVNRVCQSLLYSFMSSAVVYHDFASFLFLNKMYALQTFTNDKW